MNKKIRRILTVGTACALLMSTTVMAMTPIEENRQVVNYFFSSDKQIMVPVREEGEALGFKVDWHAAQQEVILENGTTKVVFKIGEDAYQKSSGRLSGECIMMYVPKELGEKAILKEGKVFVPIELFDYVLDVQGVLTLQDNILVEKDGIKLSYYKEIPLQLGDKVYSISINLPDYIGPYITFTSEMIKTGTMTYPLCFLRFENEEGISNIGTFSVFTHEQFESVKAENGPVPTEVLTTADYVITFTGLLDMPFELGTNAAEIVGRYHQEMGNILKTLTFVPR